LTVVVLGNLGEAEFFVVIRPDPLGGIDRAFFECWVDIAGRELLRHRADPCQNGAGKTADAEFEPFEIFGRIDQPDAGGLQELTTFHGVSAR